MTGRHKRTIIEMARQVGYPIQHEEWRKATEEFAALVREDERNRTWTQQHWTDYERSIAAAEREKCARVCDDRAFRFFSESPFFVEMHDLAEAIRARNKHD